ncbi:putative late blight resistance protein homolog R1B-13 [Salvia hispanica]|uniref:putative late blight resistance protein homolog R1B-13 n=1 Tax=Salvia hispanica TaxID=49212 RepID=UPI002009A503|nr:putative late blight resistance protein homolog R1B-13 [Salvia hispanica]
MADAVANVSLEILRDLLVEETKFLLSVGGDVEKVKADLRSIHALRNSPTLKLYISQLKDLAFKAENLLETYAVEVESKREEGRRSLKDKFKRYICIMCECSSVHEVGNEARDIISALADLTKKLESELDHQGSSSHSNQEAERLLRQTYGHEVEHDFVGMEKDIQLLVSKVKDETRRKRVVKIYGMGGLGKTTLARKVYNHTDLQSYARAWVCITQQFEHKAILGKILKQLDKDINVGILDVEDLVTRIHSLLVERKCVIVIDDIWEDIHWEIIKQAFPVNCNVILTTRSQNIAIQESEPHKLRFLTEDEGWALLQKVADLSPDIKSLEDVGREIVSKCQGLPLSIRVIGGILRSKEYDLPEWKKLKQEKFLKRIDASKYLTDILSPTQTRLVIPPSIGNSISRLAISCDFEREVSGIDGLEEVKGLRSFILLQKSYGMIDFKESTIDFKMSQYLRIFVVEGCEFEGEKLPSKVGELIHLRYLSLRDSNVRELPKSICNLPYLQTLDLQVRDGIRLPNVICKMKRLKHLFLPFGDIEVIGGEKLRLDGLHELETLEWINSETTCIADIPKLISLQSLHVKVCDEDSMSIVLSNKNSQLRETRLHVKSCDLSSEKDMEVLNEGLMSPSLVTLKMVECNMSGGFPYYKQGMCQNLVTLRLYNCKGKVDVEEFGKYPMLQVLALDHFVKMAETITFRSNSFPQLKLLELYKLPDLKKWEVEKGAMPKLTSLFIAECRNLEKVPDGLRLSSSLRQIKIINMPREFSERVKEEDYGPFVEKSITGASA